MRYPALAALILGVVAACGFAPLDLWWLALPAVAAWMWLIHKAPDMRQALWRGWAFGLGHFTINNNWFQHAFTFQDKMPSELGYAAPFALALYLAVYPAIAAGLAWRTRRGTIDAAWVLLFAAAWMLAEWLRSWVFTGYAWDPLGVAWLGLPLPAIALLGREIGTYALSGLFVVAAGALCLLAVRREWRLAAILAASGVAQVVRIAVEPPLPVAAPDGPRLVVVQPNVPQDQRGESDQEMMLDRLTRLSGTPGAAPRLVLWPEGVMRHLIELDYPLWVYGATSPYATRQRLASVLGARDILMTGGDALRFDDRGDLVAATNSVFAINAGRQVEARYDKAHLVPYGEYLPMPWLLKPLGLARLVPGDMDFLPGAGPQTFDLPGFGPIGVQICYEIIFSGEVIDGKHRPRLLFNPSNDAWFGAWGPPQHLRQAQMRAIEEGVPVVRATPNGISAIISADGVLLGSVPHKRAGNIDLPMPAVRPATLFSRLGNWAGSIVAALLVAGAIALRRRRR